MSKPPRKTDPAFVRGGRPPKADSEVTSELLASGEATMAQIAQLFETDAKTLPKRMKGIVPRGTRRGYKVYRIREAATRLVEPGYEIEDFIRQMSPQELPPLLQKEFWNGQRARLEYEKQLGNHWPTEEVVSAFGEMANTVRITLLLIADDVDREAGLTDGQRTIIRRIMDAAVTTLKNNMVEKFKEYHANRADPRLPDDDEPGRTHVISHGPIDDDWNIVAEEDDDGNILASEDDEEEDIGI